MGEYRAGDPFTTKAAPAGGHDPTPTSASSPAAKPATSPAAPPSDLDFAIDEIAPARTMKEGFTGQER